MSLTTVEINHDLETCTASPVQCSTEEFVCALNVGCVVVFDHRPVANRNTDVVHACSSDLVQVIFGDPGVPVL